MSSHRPASLSVVLFAAVAPFLWMSGPAVGTPGDRKFPPVAKTVLRVARSADGLTFQDTGEVFMERAAAPDVELVGGDRVIAVFDSAEEGSQSPRLSVSHSNDGGKT